MKHIDFLASGGCGNMKFIHRAILDAAWNYRLIEGKSERLLDLRKQARAAEYMSGPAAKDYIESRSFDEAGIKQVWFDYTDCPEYPQMWGKFIHGVSILDLMFNCGKDSPKYMRCVRGIFA